VAARTCQEIPMRTLTRRQRQVLDFIGGYLAENHVSPSVREIMRHLGLRSPHAVACHLEALERKGYLRRQPLVPRGIQLTDPKRKVPIAGQVSAGPLTAALEFEPAALLEALSGARRLLVRVLANSSTARPPAGGWLLVVCCPHDGE
jgi:repressor LexA